ncbi:MAG: DoxX family protein [Acidimicrobiales bacterium]
MRHFALLACRLVLGSYFVVHGVKKVSKLCGGAGLDATAKGFEAMGIRPGKTGAALAGASQLAGGILVLTGAADPVGPLLIAGNMAVASVALREKGPMAQHGGFELPLVNLALASALVITGPGRLSIGTRLPKALLRVFVGVGASLTMNAVTTLLQSQRARSRATIAE